MWGDESDEGRETKTEDLIRKKKIRICKTINDLCLKSVEMNGQRADTLYRPISYG